MFKKYYLAYGSNLNLLYMERRAPGSQVIGTAMLHDVRLVYKGSADNYAYLTLEKFKGGNVPVGIYEVPLLSIKSLDSCEGYPTLYSKNYVPIQIGVKSKEALLYLMNAGYGYCMPSQEYIDACRDGYCDFGFDLEILEQALVDTKNAIKKKTYPR